MPLYYSLRFLLHLLLASISLFLLLLTTSPFDKLESSEELDLRRQILVFAATSLGATFVFRVEEVVGSMMGTVRAELVEGDGPRKGMTSLGLIGALSWGAIVYHLDSSPISNRSPLLLVLCSTMAFLSFVSSFLHLILSNPVPLVEGPSTLGQLEEQHGDQRKSLFDDADLGEKESSESLSDLVSLSLLAGSILSVGVSFVLVSLYEMDCSAGLLLISSILIIPPTLFSRHRHRARLIIATSITLILHCFTVASYAFAFASDLHPLCAVFFDQNPSLAITYPPPTECELSQSLLFLSSFTLVALAGRLVVLHSTPKRRGEMAFDSSMEGWGGREEKRTVASTKFTR